MTELIESRGQPRVGEVIPDPAALGRCHDETAAPEARQVVRDVRFRQPEVRGQLRRIVPAIEEAQQDPTTSLVSQGLRHSSEPTRQDSRHTKTIVQSWLNYGAAAGRRRARSRGDDARVDDLNRRAVAEFVGTAFLLAIVVGSGIAGERLADSDGLALLINAFATGAGLTALILALGPASGGHFNPLVTACDWWLGGVQGRAAATYVAAQVSGAVVGVGAANVIYGLPVVNLSDKVRNEEALWASEALATFGLMLVIWGCVRSGQAAVTAFAVGGYIAAAYFFTSSTSFANPAVTVARTLSDTFAGIRPVDVPAFLPAQIIGAFAATALMRWLYPALREESQEAVVPRDVESDA